MGLVIPLFTAVYLNNKGKGNSWLKYATCSLIGSSTSLCYPTEILSHPQKAKKWVETLHPKRVFWRFPDFKRGKYSLSSPIPSMQCCAAVQATLRKQQTPQLWMEGTGDRCAWFLCSLKLPYLSTISQQFCRRLIAAVGEWWLVPLDHPIITTHNLTKNLISRALKPG